MSTRTPCSNPREAMEVLAKLLGVTLKPSLRFFEAFPEFDIEIRIGEHSATVYVTPERSGIDKNSQELFVIGCRVSWPTTTYDASGAVLAAQVHVLAAQKAMIVESVAQGRKWTHSQITGEKE